ncbi:G-rich sequence factor 1 isoform X1 [Mobula birostris]|uniref:G-rich sequence factor 1 isoform X1 n=1 Tax=Mobula birostris TaxID=1983395 RepID=UPI003B28981E
MRVWDAALSSDAQNSIASPVLQEALWPEVRTGSAVAGGLLPQCRAGRREGGAGLLAARDPATRCDPVSMAVSCRLGAFLNLRAVSRAYGHSVAGRLRPCFPLPPLREPQARGWAAGWSRASAGQQRPYSQQELQQPFQEEEYPPLPDYEPCLLEMDQNVFVVKARGLPWSCSAEDVLDFFSDCGVVNGVGGVHFLCNRAGKPSGEAIIELQSAEDVRKALEKHRKYLGQRYIEVFELTNNDVDFLLKRLHSSGKELIDGSTVRLRGLPYSCTTEDITRFFAGLEIVEDGVALTRDHRGRNTGDAFVQFASQEMAERALAKDREMIGSRYIEIFRSTKSDLRLYIRPSKKMPRCPTAQEIATDNESCAVVNSNSDNGDMMERDGRVQNVQLPKNDLESNHCIQRSDVHNVHMRGLPFRVNGQDVVKFFQPLKPVRIIVEYGPDGKATGEADVHFATHEDAVAAMTKDKSHMQHRYIELYLNSFCSGIPTRHNDQGNQEKGSEER